LNDGSGRIALDKDGRLVGLDSLGSATREDARAALDSGHVKITKDIEALIGKSGTLMGGPPVRESYALQDPVGTVVRSDRPTFRWRTVPGAATYEVTIYAAGYNQLASSGPQSETSWTPSVRLARGQVYTWQVVTTVEGKQVVLPPPAAPRAKFKILALSALTEIEEVEKAHQKSHLILGILYARYGLIEEALRELQVVVANNP